MINKKYYNEFITLYNNIKEIDSYYIRKDVKINKIKILQNGISENNSILFCIKNKINELNKNNYFEFIGILEGFSISLKIYCAINLI